MLKLGEPAGRPVTVSAPETDRAHRQGASRKGPPVGHGPLTNLAVALRLEPKLPRLVPGVTIMGGAASAPGNVTPAAEANIWHDPEAAQAVFSAPWATTLVPLDATMGELMSEQQRLSLAGSRSPTARFAAAILDHYFDFYTPVFGRRSCPCHDALAAASPPARWCPRRP